MIDSAVLNRVGLFADLSKYDLDILARGMSRRRYARGQVIFMKGEPGTTLYVVEEGQVKVVVTSEQGDELILRVLGSGESFGELALLDGALRWADAVAQKSSLLLALRRDDFLPFIRARPEVATRLVSILDAWLHRLTALAEDEAFLDVQGRLAKILLDLSDANNRPGEDGLVVSPRVTQLELAGMIGTTRRSVSKWLGYYQREGLIRLEKGYITLLQPEVLRKHVSP